LAEPPVTFAGLLRKLRTEAGLTQEELAEASGVRPRSISDLERGVAVTPQRDTLRRLADALNLTGLVRAQFEAVARGRTLPTPTAAISGGTAVATRTLPRDVASFTGRQHELEELVNATAGQAGLGTVVSIHAIGGMAGVGKTAFAVHAAHRLADRFPGGQIFLPLHGHTSGQQPVDPADALASLLLTAGVPAGQIPPSLEARMALWRDRLAEKQLLLVLDDAASSEQVRPLLPGAGGSLVLVTSRRHLSALEDTTAISLDTLPPGEAAALLVRLAARPGLSAADPAVRELTGLCGFLPLAIGMLARQLNHHPAWTLDWLAGELAAAVDRLELMATENLSVAAAFDLSYADLTPDQQRLFRRLGLHPGTDIDAYAAAALAGTDQAAARHGLEALYDQYLLTEPAQGRFRMHDLIREHSNTLAANLDTERDRDEAAVRLLDHYQQTAARADSFLARQTRTTNPTALADIAQVAAPTLASREQALTWARAERTALLACLDQTGATGQHARVVDLTANLAALLRQDGPWAEAMTRHAAAAKAAQYLGDHLGQANALNNLGDVRRLTGDYPGATQDLTQALDIYRELGDRLGQANALNNLGIVRRLTGDYPGAAHDLTQALDIYRELGDRPGQADALGNLGDAWRVAGDFPAAIPALEEALSMSRGLGDRLGQANALKSLGDLRRLTGDYPGAARDLAESLDIYRELGEKLGQANVLGNLGDAQRLNGDYPGAARAQEQALDIYRELGDRLGQANALTSMANIRQLTGDWPGAAQALTQTLGIYREIGDRVGQANVLTYLGIGRRIAGDYPGAARDLQEALDISRDIGNRLSQANALTYLASVQQLTGDYHDAIQALEEALDISLHIDSQLSQANALLFLGAVRRATGDYLDATQNLQEALRIYRDHGDRSGEVEALNESGTLNRVRGDLAQAQEYHRQALDLARATGRSWDEAHALAGLGRCARADGHAAQAEILLRQSAEIFQRIGAAEAPELLAELDAITSQ
jgi:tetratricopeptide (TPR) repeat protein/transcriptional regulator with XRE-family HTH domain